VFGAALLFVTVPISATPTPVPLFNQCSALGQALGCSNVLVFGTQGSVNLLFDENVKDVEGKIDILTNVGKRK
jgi:hypothetical protein